MHWNQTSHSKSVEMDTENVEYRAPILRNLSLIQILSPLKIQGCQNPTFYNHHLKPLPSEWNLRTWTWAETPVPLFKRRRHLLVTRKSYLVMHSYLSHTPNRSLEVKPLWSAKMAAKAKLVAAIETTSFKCCWTSLLSPPFRGSPQQTTEPSSRIAAWGEHHRLSPLKPKEKLIFWTKAIGNFCQPSESFLPI